MTRHLTVTSSPHIRSSRTTKNIMLDVVIALLPTVAAAGYLFGVRALLLIAIAALTSVLAEYAWCLAMKKPDATKDFSAVVTGILLACNVPVNMPVWQLMLGCVVAIVVIKQLFGGIGFNFVNPALGARVVMGLSFPASMTNYAYATGTPDILSNATPLTIVSATTGATAAPDLMTLLLGQHGGVLGETCAIAILIGGVYLIVRKVIKPIIPLCYIGTVLVLHVLFGSALPVHSILSGGLFFGAFFMATDYTTSPFSDLGKIVFAVGCGILTASIRVFSTATEGVTYGILLMNLLVPYINSLTRRRPYGEAKK